MIEGYVGRPGSGKTYTLTARVLDEAATGRQVFSNYRVKHPNVERITIEDLVDPDMPPGLVVIDEAHLWFPARLSLKLPPSLLMRWSQTRKAGWDILWSAQHPKRIDSIIRDNSNILWHCRAWKGLLSTETRYFTSVSYEPENYRRKGAHMTRVVRRFSRTVAEAYDTLETLATAAHVQAVADPYSGAGRRRGGA